MFGFSSLRCVDCTWLDTNDKNRYGECYCPEERKYVSPSEQTCRYFKPNFYVMTAYCNIKKMPYNCFEMVTLIKLRDKYMVNNDEGIEFLEEYETVGKELALRLQTDPYKTDIVNSMEEEYILPAIELIYEQRLDEAQNCYIRMINNLKIRYGLAPKIKRL